MDERKVTNHWHFGDLGLNALMLIILAGTGLVLLVLMAIQGIVAAIVSLAVLATLFLITFGVILALAIMAQVHKHEQRRAEAEQARFRDNTKENLANLELQARAQLAQARAQGEQWKVIRNEVDTRQKLLPAGNGDAVGFDFSDIDFSELEN